MKILDILNPFASMKEAEVLEEARLSSEFKIGFELEGICDSDIEGLSSSGNLPSYHSSSSPFGGAKNLLDMLDERLGLGHGKIERDGSLNTSGVNKTGHAWAFEYGSPIIPFNPTNVNKISKFLTGLKDIGVYTNESCGFHTHISFKDISRDDAKWILFCIANDDDLRLEFSEMQVDGEEPIKFYGTYATDDWFRAFKVTGKFEDWSISKDTSDKYLIVRIHPEAGTLEWRGPRNFINDGSNSALIKSYIKKLYNLVLKIGKIVDMKEYNGFKKSEVLNKMNITGRFNSPFEQISEKNASELARLVRKKPMILVTLQPSKLEKLVKISSGVSDIAGYDSSEEFMKIWPKIPTKNKKILLQVMNSQHETYTLSKLASQNENKLLDAMTSQIIIESGLQNLMILCQDILLITTTQQLNKILKIGNLDDNKKIKLMIKFQHLLDMNSYKSILDGRSFHLIRRFNSVPVKIQRMLIRRNPYNIQYINNPDQSVIDELRKKYGEDIDEYILGVL